MLLSHKLFGTDAQLVEAIQGTAGSCPGLVE